MSLMPSGALREVGFRISAALHAAEFCNVCSDKGLVRCTFISLVCKRVVLVTEDIFALFFVTFSNYSLCKSQITYTVVMVVLMQILSKGPLSRVKC
jgi:hypothetical protein